MKLMRCAAILAGILILMMSGCASKRGPAEKVVLVGYDYSGSVKIEQKEQYDGIISSLVDLQRGNADVCLWKYAQTADKIYEGRPMGSRDIWDSVDEHFIDDNTKGCTTIIAPVLERFYQKAKDEKRPTYLVLATDGECFDEEATKAAAEKLAALPNVKGIIVAPVIIQYRTRTKLENALAPFGCRLITATDAEIEGAIKRFTEKQEEMGR